MNTWFWIFSWFLSIVAITGNGFIIFLVLSKRQLRTKTNAFVVSLAVADLFVGLSAVPSLFFCELATGCNSQAFLADGMDFVRWPFVYGSVINLCSLVLDRYIAIVKPLQYLSCIKRERVILMLCLSWTIPVTFLMVICLVWRISTIPLVFHIFVWLLMLFFELSPCLIMIFCFISMLRVVWKHNQTARTLAKQLRFNHQVFFKGHERSAVIMMAVVIGLFVLCYAFYLRCSFVLLFSPDQPCDDQEYKIPLLVINSAINPVAYACCKRDLKKEIKRRLCCWTIVEKRKKIEPVNVDNCFTLERRLGKEDFPTAW